MLCVTCSSDAVVSVGQHGEVEGLKEVVVLSQQRRVAGTHDGEIIANCKGRNKIAAGGGLKTRHPGRTYPIETI